MRFLSLSWHWNMCLQFYLNPLGIHICIKCLRSFLLEFRCLSQLNKIQHSLPLFALNPHVLEKLNYILIRFCFKFLMGHNMIPIGLWSGCIIWTKSCSKPSTPHAQTKKKQDYIHSATLARSPLLSVVGVPPLFLPSLIIFSLCPVWGSALSSEKLFAI